ncbi:MAG: HrpJ domain-containing protein [Pseudomonadota bacterium]
MSVSNTTVAPTEVLRVQTATHAATTDAARTMGRNPATMEQVTALNDGVADLTDALEELGSAVANRRKPRLDEAKVRKGQGVNTEALGRIAQYQEKLPDLPQDHRLLELTRQLERFQERMERGADRPTKDDVLEALRAYSEDVSHQAAALEQMRKGAFAAGAGRNFLALLDAVRADYREGRVARDVAAGFAIAKAAHDEADTIGGDPQQIRDAYRNVVRSSQHLGQIFDHLKGFNIAQNFDAIVGTFLKSAAAELDLLSRENPELIGDTRTLLQGVVGELQKLKLLASVHDDVAQGLALLTRMHPQLATR